MFIQSDLVSVNVFSEYGVGFPWFKYNGVVYVGIPDNTRYNIGVANLCTSRIEVVTAVDGRDTLKQAPAQLKNDGFVISPSYYHHFKGFRIDDMRIIEFVHRYDADRSVAVATTGSGDLCGVISLAVFTEKSTKIYRDTMSEGRQYNNSSDFQFMKGGPDTLRSETTSRSGTGIGNISVDKVGQTEFVRSSADPQALIDIHYRPIEWVETIIQTIGRVPPSGFQKPTTGYEKLAGI
jgi:hypothetical protein